MASAVADLSVDDVPEHLLCSICFELPDSEVYQCVDGHVLCKACFVKLKECPHCRRSFGVTPPIRNRHFEALLEDLKKNCPFNSNGCREKLARNALDSHKATCPYNFEKKEALLPNSLKNDIWKQPSPLPSRTVTVDKEELFSLAENGDLQSFKSIVNAAPQHKNAKNEVGMSLLHFTMCDPDKKVGLEKAKFLVEEMNADIFVLTNYKASLLHYAAQCSDDKAVKYFVEKGLDINAVGDFSGTPLHSACFSSKFGEANTKMLLRYNPNCTLKNNCGLTPLDKAVFFEKVEIAKLIKKALLRK